MTLSFLCLSLLPGGAAGSAGAGTGPVDVYVIPVNGDVEPAMAAYIERAVLEAGTDTEAIIVLEIDTFGGRVDSALKIVDTMTGVKGPRTIAYVKNKAISAGALIALSANDLVMRPSTTIGDCAPISFTQEGPAMLGEKIPVAAKGQSFEPWPGVTAIRSPWPSRWSAPTWKSMKSKWLTKPCTLTPLI